MPKRNTSFNFRHTCHTKQTLRNFLRRNSLKSEQWSNKKNAEIIRKKMRRGLNFKSI